MRSVPSHRILAMLRGEREAVLRLRVEPPAERAVAVLTRLFVKNATPAAQQVTLAMEDGYKRLLSPSIEGETRLELKRRADVEAIRVFAENLRELLMAPPLGRRRVMGLDPGFRTGCKLVCLDAQGKLLHHDTIYPHTGGAKAEEAGRMVTRLVAKFDIEAIAVGNGTAGRETERFLADLGLPPSVTVIAVNESGASVYSASEAAREEFPDHDVTVRGSVSIARRLTDPLAELVKIDPKAIGVGQYQHDVNQVALKRSLDDVVSSCVNAVGVDVNTASKQLLTYVSGLGPVLAANIVAHRDEHGAFGSRKALLKVARLGPKAFEQAAGFLRVNGGDNPLDASAVHPESYAVVDAMAADLGCATPDLLRDAALRSRIDLEAVRHRDRRPADPEGHPRRAGETGPRPAAVVRGLPLRRRRREARGPGRGHGGARHRDQRDRLRRLRGRRRAPGRPGAHQPARRPLRARPRRGGEGRAAGEGARAERGPAAQADRAVDEEPGVGGAPGGVTACRLHRCVSESISREWRLLRTGVAQLRTPGSHKSPPLQNPTATPSIVGSSPM